MRTGSAVYFRTRGNHNFFAHTHFFAGNFYLSPSRIFPRVIYHPRAACITMRAGTNLTVEQCARVPRFIFLTARISVGPCAFPRGIELIDRVLVLHGLKLYDTSPSLVNMLMMLPLMTLISNQSYKTFSLCRLIAYGCYIFNADQSS